MKYLISHQIKVLAECLRDYKDVWDRVPQMLCLSFQNPRYSMKDIKFIMGLENYVTLFKRVLGGLKTIKKMGKTLSRAAYKEIFKSADTLLETLNEIENKNEVPVKNSENELMKIIEILHKRAESLLAKKRKRTLTLKESEAINSKIIKDIMTKFPYIIEGEIAKKKREYDESKKDEEQKEKRDIELGEELQKGLSRKAKRDIKVYLDMDHCITDFDKAVKKLGSKAAKGLKDDAVEEEKQYMYDKIEEAGSKFWSEMEWCPKGQELWKTVKKYNPVLLSSPGKFKWAPAGKENWVSANLPGISLFLEMDKYIYAEPDAVLIDDRSSNIEGWKDAGGIGILYEDNPESVKEQLKEILRQP